MEWVELVSPEWVGAVSPEWVELVSSEPASPGFWEELVTRVVEWDEEGRREFERDDSMGGWFEGWGCGSGLDIKDGALG